MADQMTALSPIDEALKVIREHLVRVRFGTIAVTIHEGKIVQMDITEKRRLA